MPAAKTADAAKPATAERIVRSARDLFLKQGYRDTSLDEIAREAGVTKPTVYSHFGSKQGLLLAMVREHVSRNAEALSTSLIASGNTAADLQTFGTAFLSRLMSREEVRWRRLAIAEATEHPEIGEAIYSAGPARVLKAITRFVKQETIEGRLSCPDPELAAEQFVGLLIGVNPIRETAGRPMPGKEKKKRICDAAVRTFMSAYGSGDLREEPGQ